MSGPYDDIINLPHPTSQRHPRMPIHDRAAIFSPFAALSGHGAAIAETARLTEQRIELDEDSRTVRPGPGPLPGERLLPSLRGGGL